MGDEQRATQSGATGHQHDRGPDRPRDQRGTPGARGTQRTHGKHGTRVTPGTHQTPEARDPRASRAAHDAPRPTPVSEVFPVEPDAEAWIVRLPDQEIRCLDVADALAIARLPRLVDRLVAGNLPRTEEPLARETLAACRRHGVRAMGVDHLERVLGQRGV